MAEINFDKSIYHKFRCIKSIDFRINHVIEDDGREYYQLIHTVNDKFVFINDHPFPISDNEKSLCEIIEYISNYYSLPFV